MPEMPKMYVRPVEIGDVDALVKLAGTVDGHMTTLPRDEGAMTARVEASLASFAARPETPGAEIYLFVLVDDGEIVGLSAIFATVGLDRPFYSYRVSKLAKKSPEIDIQVNTDVLHLVNDYGGSAELGTLFLRPDKRGGGRGRLLSYARLMFIVCQRKRFPERIFAEIRGQTDAADGSPFWDAVGRRFFKLDFAEADLLSGRDYRFIADLMPTLPIYVELLPDAARDAIGKVNDGALGAARLLLDQGLSYSGLVDIFDAGACLDARIDEVAVVHDAKHLAAVQATGQWATSKALVARACSDGFRVITSDAAVESGGKLSLSKRDLGLLGMNRGEHAVVYTIPTRDEKAPPETS